MVEESKSKTPTAKASNSTMPEAEPPAPEADSYSGKLMEQLVKTLGQQPFPGVDTAAILESILKNMAALGEANKHIFKNAEAVMLRQGEILRQTLVEASAAVDELANARNPQQFAAKQGDLLRGILLRTLNDMRHEANTTLKSSNEAFAEAFTTINSRVIRNVQEITELIRQLEK
jgi:phasin family protein